MSFGHIIAGVGGGKQKNIHPWHNDQPLNKNHMLFCISEVMYAFYVWVQLKKKETKLVTVLLPSEEKSKENVRQSKGNFFLPKKSLVIQTSIVCWFIQN